MPEKNKRKPRNGKTIKPLEPSHYMTLEELGLPTADDMISMFFNTTSLEVAKAVSKWVHTPDCSPDARHIIRAALKLDGSLAQSKNYKVLFKCPTCCDSGRTSNGDKFIDCPRCQPNQK